MKNKFKLGADPEVFLLRNGIPISAIDVIQGTKHDPFKISTFGHSVQVDNVLLEFNVPPSDNPEDMFKNISFIMEWFKNNLPKDMTTEISSSRIFDDMELLDPKALEFGCDPDFSAWREEMNVAPSSKTNLRSAGGHIHISYENSSMDRSVDLIKACDLFLGVPSILMDYDKQRRLLYGKAGAFRFKTYPNGDFGAEYRTLSNFWIADLELVKFIYAQMDKAITFINEHPNVLNINTQLGQDIINCIDNGDEELAQKLCNENNIL